MSVNVSARSTRILIGAKDFSSCFVSFQGSDSHLDQSGLIAFTGSITLGRSLGFDESLDDRKNSRFFRGQVITIEIQDSQGIFRKHPRGALRIISPKYSDDSQRLTIDVGDLISLLNFREPTDPSKMEIKLGQNTTAGQIIQRLLLAAGITAIGGILPNTIINYPINLSGSYLANAGKILYANNLFGWIDKNEVFQIRPANIAAVTPAVTVIIGRDEVWYKRLDSAESPCDIVKAVGRCTIIRPTTFRDDTTEQYGAATLVDKSAGSNTITIKSTTIKENWLPGQKLLITTTTTKQPIGLVIPKELLNSSGSKLQLIKSEVKVETSYYEQDAEGKLKKKTTLTNGLLAPAILEFAKIKTNYFFNIFSLTESYKDSYSYEYDVKDRLRKVVTEVSEIAGNLLSGTEEDWSKWIFPPNFLTQAESKTETWEETSKDIWEYEYYTYQPLIKVKPDLAEVGSETGTQGPTSNKLDLLYADGSRQTSNSGQLAPPAPEREPAPFTAEEEDLEEKVTFLILGGNSNLRPRERVFTVECLASVTKPGLKRGEVTVSLGTTQANNQLRAIAQREGRLQWGRYKGQQIAVALSDIWFDYHPLFEIKSVEKDGTQQAFLADGCSWVVGQTRVLVSCDAIWLGSWQATPSLEPYVAPPYYEVPTLDFGLGMGASFNSYAYQLTSTPHTTQAGLGLASTWLSISIEPPTLSLTWNTVDWDSLSAQAWNSIAADDNYTQDWDALEWDALSAQVWDAIVNGNHWETHNWEALDSSRWDALNNLSYWEIANWEYLDWENLV
ncbi:MAG: hypothetical protein V7K47_07080 [Nostoc sp.]